jgi:hypothetical protein
MQKVARLRRPVPILLSGALIACMTAGCGSESSAALPLGSAPAQHASASAAAATAARPPATASPTPVVAPPARVTGTWTQFATVHGLPAAWIARRSGVTLMRLDQSLVHLALHAGSAEPGGAWAQGDHIGSHEIHRVLAAFNSGFKLNYKGVGFLAGGRVAVPLGAGLGSVVTYQNGSTQIGAWHAGVPARGVPIASVRQNLRLLVDHGVPARTVHYCIVSCWGLTVGAGTSVPRSALGINAQNELVWAAGEHLSPASLARVLVEVGVQRAVQLDINGGWVAGYTYVHRPGGPAAVPLVPGQRGILGKYLSPWTRDFFTVLSN